jgi:hypothetical protein
VVKVVPARHLHKALPSVQSHGCVIIVDDMEVNGPTQRLLSMLNDPLHQLGANTSFPANKASQCLPPTDCTFFFVFFFFFSLFLSLFLSFFLTPENFPWGTAEPLAFNLFVRKTY